LLSITLAKQTYIHTEFNILFDKRLRQYFKAHTYSSILPKEIKSEIQQDRQ